MAEISTTEIASGELLKCVQPNWAVGFRPMPNSATLRELKFYEDLAWRLKLAVEAVGVPKGQIAERIGVSPQRLSNWITRQNKPDWFGVARFCQAFGVSADWILLGDVSGLKHSLAVSLERAAVEKPEGETGTEPHPP